MTHDDAQQIIVILKAIQSHLYWMIVALLIIWSGILTSRRR